MAAYKLGSLSFMQDETGVQAWLESKTYDLSVTY